MLFFLYNAIVDLAISLGLSLCITFILSNSGFNADIAFLFRYIFAIAKRLIGIKTKRPIRVNKMIATASPTPTSWVKNAIDCTIKLVKKFQISISTSFFDILCQK